MNALELKATEQTPSITFYPEQGELEIKGNSISENSVKFYRPLLESIEQFLFKPVSPTMVHIRLGYFNTASAKCIVELLKKLETLPKKGIRVEVNWYYKSDDTVMYHAGIDYKSILNLDFKMVKI